jgi:hypothetical protein
MRDDQRLRCAALSVLCAILFGCGGGARDAARVEFLKVAGLALLMVEQESGRFPEDWGPVSGRQLAAARDAAGSELALGEDLELSQFIYLGAGLRVDVGSPPSERIIVATDGPAAAGQMFLVLFADGHVMGYPEARGLQEVRHRDQTLLLPDEFMDIQACLTAGGPIAEQIGHKPFASWQDYHRVCRAAAAAWLDALGDLSCAEARARIELAASEALDSLSFDVSERARPLAAELEQLIREAPAAADAPTPAGLQQKLRRFEAETTRVRATVRHQGVLTRTRLQILSERCGDAAVTAAE